MDIRGAGSLGVEDMGLRVMGERECLLLPVNVRVEALQPGHTKDGIIVGQTEDGEINVVAVGAYLYKGVFEEIRGGGGGAISQGDHLLLGAGSGLHVVAGGELSGDEITGGSGINEDNSWDSIDGAM
jgi:hypothetical protein